jgi:hypothetical protein
MEPTIPAVIAAVRQLPGNQGIQTGIDRVSGKTFSVSTFDTLEHAQFQRASLGAVFAALQAAGWQPEAPEIYKAWE